MNKPKKIEIQCKSCFKTISIILSKEGKQKFCNRICSKEYNKTKEAKSERSKRIKKTWAGLDGLARKKKQSENLKKMYKEEPERKKQSVKNLSKVHKKVAAGTQVCFHTDKFKQELSKRAKLPKSKETKQRIKESHWSTTENRQSIIDGTRYKVWGNEEKANETKKKQSKTRATKLASGEIKLLNGNKGFYFSTKTKIKESYDSLYELFVMQELDENPDILFWTKNHGIVISYKFNNNQKNYVPDFLIKTKGDIVLQEIKSPWSHGLHPEINTLKKEAGEIFCASKNYKFIWSIITLSYKQIKQLNAEHKKTT